MSETTMYGIRECDTCRKAQRWASDNGHQVGFHDLRRDGLEPEQVETWLQSVDMNSLVNRRSRTWRALSEAQRSQLDTELLLEHPTLIKRPVLVREGRVLDVGFKPDRWERLL